MGKGQPVIPQDDGEETEGHGEGNETVDPVEGEAGPSGDNGTEGSEEDG